MDIDRAIKQLTGHQDLEAEDMIAVMGDIMRGLTSEVQNAAFLVGLQMKGVKAAELLGGAKVMRELSTRVEVAHREHLVDTCGTGGSGCGTFNVSTAAAIVAAAGGARVAKHGNRGATSSSGSADVLEAAGVNLMLNPGQVARAVDEVGIGFLFAPSHHSAMRYVAGVRRELGVRTVFNLLGPLTNPAAAPNQVLGVFDAAWILPMLEVLRELGSEHVLVVAAEDGLDEISLVAPTRVGELKGGQITDYLIKPEDFGVNGHADYRALQVSSPAESLALLQAALSGQHEAAGDIVALNAGAALYVAGLAEDLAAGIEQARVILDSGVALRKLEQLVSFSAQFA